MPKRLFGYAKVQYRGLAKNAAQVLTLFALSRLWMARRQKDPYVCKVEKAAKYTSHIPSRDRM